MIELERHAFHDNQELDIHRLSGLQFGLQFIAVQPRPGKTGWRAPEMPPRCPRTAIKSQRSPPAATCEPEAGAGFEASKQRT